MVPVTRSEHHRTRISLLLKNTPPHEITENRPIPLMES
jgi:hypothetical protein